MGHSDDYRLERWLAALFSLLFLLPVVADAQPVAPGAPTLPACQVDVSYGSPILEREPDVQLDTPVRPFEPARVSVLERRSSCSHRF